MSNGSPISRSRQKYLLSISGCVISNRATTSSIAGRLREARHAAAADRPEPVIKDADARRLVGHLRRSADPACAIEGRRRASRSVAAEVEWTFPLDFVEVVWGDGVKTDRQIIAATDLPPFGTHKFSIPFNAAGKKWVRFAAWDSAGNGATTQPIKLTAVPTRSSGAK
jgi:hypothetical protein